MPDWLTFSSRYFQKVQDYMTGGQASDDPIPDFMKLFRDRVLVWKWDSGTRYGVIRNYFAGDLRLPSGALVACDPGGYPHVEHHTFNRQFQPGTYPVFLTVMHTASGGGRVTLARVQFTDATPVKWANAFNEPIDGFPTDMATAGFMDARLAMSIDDRLEDDRSTDNDWAASEEIHALLLDEHDDFENRDSWAANITLDWYPEANIISFEAGIGDGVYPCYWGFDGDGQIVCAVIDFWIHDVETASEWADTGFPAIPDKFDSGFFQWVEAMQPHLKKTLLTRAPMSEQDLSFVSANGRVTIPSDIAIFYAHATPWGNIQDSQQQWRAFMERIRQEEVRLPDLDTEKPILPVDFSNPDAVDIAVIDNQHYSLVNVYEWHPHWLDHRITEAHYLKRDLRTYLITRVLDGLESVD